MKKTLGITAILLSATVGANAAIVLNDVVKIDFGGTDPTVTNWNKAVVNTTTTDLARFSDGANSGVSIQVASAGTGGGNGSNHLNGSSFGGSSAASIYVDHVFDNAGATAADRQLTFTLSGLDERLTYNLFGGFLRNSDAFEHVWNVNGDTRTNLFDGTNVNGFETFNGVVAAATATGNPLGQRGEITFTITAASASDIASLGELTVTAVPEPSSAALLMGGMGAFMLLRRRA